MKIELCKVLLFVSGAMREEIVLDLFKSLKFTYCLKSIGEKIFDIIFYSCDDVMEALVCFFGLSIDLCTFDLIEVKIKKECHHKKDHCCDDHNIVFNRFDFHAHPLN